MRTRCATGLRYSPLEPESSVANFAALLAPRRSGPAARVQPRFPSRRRREGAAARSVVVSSSAARASAFEVVYLPARPGAKSRPGLSPRSRPGPGRRRTSRRVPPRCPRRRCPRSEVARSAGACPSLRTRSPGAFRLPACAAASASCCARSASACRGLAEQQQVPDEHDRGRDDHPHGGQAEERERDRRDLKADQHAAAGGGGRPACAAATSSALTGAAATALGAAGAARRGRPPCSSASRRPVIGEVRLVVAVGRGNRAVAGERPRPRRRRRRGPSRASATGG